MTSLFVGCRSVWLETIEPCLYLALTTSSTRYNTLYPRHSLLNTQQIIIDLCGKIKSTLGPIMHTFTIYNPFSDTKYNNTKSSTNKNKHPVLKMNSRPATAYKYLNANMVLSTPYKVNSNCTMVRNTTNLNDDSFGLYLL